MISSLSGNNQFFWKGSICHEGAVNIAFSEKIRKKKEGDKNE